MTTINEILTKKHDKCLDLFGGTGKMLSKDVRKHVKTMDIWDIHPENKALIKKNCPNSTIKICNSYEEILKTRKRFDLIVCDNPINTNDKVEHFAIFEYILGVCKKKATIIIDVIPKKTELSQKRVANNFNELHNKNRLKFYMTGEPENIPIEHMADVYKAIIEDQGFKLDSWECKERNKNSYVHFMVLNVSK